MNIYQSLTKVETILLNLEALSLPERKRSVLLIESHYWQFRYCALKKHAAPASINMKIVDLSSACERLINGSKNQYNDFYYVSEALAAVDGMKRIFDQNKNARAKAA